jgi:hypothetical protein
MGAPDPVEHVEAKEDRRVRRWNLQERATNIQAVSRFLYVRSTHTFVFSSRVHTVHVKEIRNLFPLNEIGSG